MPTYDFECKCGRITSQVFKMSELKRFIKCTCGRKARRIISGGCILRDADIPWLPSAAKVFQKAGERPVQTRQEMKKYLKDNHLACIG